MKKDKLACGTILLNVVDFLLHHVTYEKTTKNAWDNPCATLRKDMLATNYNYIKSSIILRCKKAPQCKFILTSFV
jgi:hypothetical protein